MDQVRAIAKVIWQQRFWVLSVIGLIVAVVCWNMASGALDAQFTTRQGQINTKFTDISTLSNKTVHPNTAVNDENQKQVTEQEKIVNAVWEELYNKQKESVLKWPKELGEDFLSYIETLKFKDPIDTRMRSIYQNYIGKRFDGLLEIVKARKLEEGGAGFGGRGGGEFGGRGGEGMVAPMPGADQDYLVEWVDQDKLRAKLAFATNKPTAVQIWVTQEDLWVYETLLRVIANTNKARGSTRPDNAAIRTILALEVGPGASLPSTAHVYMPSAGAGAAGGEMGGEYGGRGGGYGGEMGGEYGGRGGGYGGEMGGEYGGRGGGYGMEGVEGDPAAADSALLANRYLDDTGAPLADGNFGSEFRQLPIKMELQIDQRYVPTLLLECANAPLPIEVKQVRINPHMSMAGIDSTAGGGYSGAGSLPGGVTMDTNDPTYAILELRGVVFIYNEPTTEAAPADPAAVDGTVAQQ